MGFSLKGYREAAELREVTCSFGGTSFLFWYAPSLYTPKFEQRLRDDLKGDVQTKFLVTLITHCVQKWEVTDEFPVVDAGHVVGYEERPVPLDEEHVSELPIAFLTAVVEALQGDQSPNATTPKPAGSFASS